MLNEHHGNPFCMGSVMNVEAAILARITNKARIVLLGNPLPVVKNPVRLAEELAEIDLISKGRLVPGWVRGAGSEQIFNQANPAYNREYFNEAHDLVMACWTRPGPFRWEGKHFNFRYVNPWALPYQKPRPPIWIPGVISAETVVWCAQHRIRTSGWARRCSPRSSCGTCTARRRRRKATWRAPRTSATCSRSIVADTEEEAQAQGRAAMFGGGAANFSRPEHTLPPGYNSKEATRRLAKQATDYGFLGITSEKLKEQREDVGRQPKEKATRASAAPGRGQHRRGQEEDLRQLSEGAGWPADHYRHAKNRYPEAQADSGSAAAGRLRLVPGATDR